MSKGYIDKEKVLSELCSDCKGIAYCRVPCALYNYIDNSSPADAKPVVRGEWISKGENAFEWCDYECSVCSQAPDYFVYGTEDWGCGELPNFCPHCGADMRKEEKDE